MDKVFVYGTLKRGHGNHRLLEGCVHLGECITLQTFVLHNVGFPVTFFKPKGHPVMGELYEIPDSIREQVLHRLDRLEGEGRMFRRETVRVLPLANTEPAVETFMYVGIPDYWGGIYQREQTKPDTSGFLSWGVNAEEHL